MRKRGNGKKDGNNNIWTLTRIIVDRIDRNRRARWNKNQEEGEWYVGGIGGSRYLGIGRIIIIIFRSKRRDMNFVDEFHARPRRRGRI